MSNLVNNQLVHSIPIRETTEMRLELAPGGFDWELWRRSTAAQCSDFVVATGFALSLDQARELRDALRLAIGQVEESAS